MKPLLTQATILCFGLPLAAAAQNNNNLLYEKVTLKEIVNFRIPDSTDAKQFTEQDWIMLRPIEETRTESTRISEDGYETNTFLISESSNAEEWELMPYRIYSDAEGITIYNSDSEVIDHLPHSKLYIEGLDSLRALRLKVGIPVLAHLPTLEELDKESLLLAGAVISGTEKSYKIKSARGEIEVDLTHNFIVEKLFKREFDIPYYTFTSYQTTKQGFLKPKFRKSLCLVKTSNGFCVEKNHSIEYSLHDFYVQPLRVYKGDSDSDLKVFSIFPNPVSSILNISIDSSVLEVPLGDDHFSIEVYNKLNDLVFHQEGLPALRENQIELSALPTGYYTLHIHKGEYHNSFKILKL